MLTAAAQARPARAGSRPPLRGDAVNTYSAALRRLHPALVLAGLFSALISVLMLTGSVYMLQVYDRVLSSGSVPTLVGLFVIVIVLYAFLGFYDFLRTRLLSRAALQLDLTAGVETFGAWIRSGIPGGAAPGNPETTQDGAQALRDLDIVRGFLAGPAITALFDTPFVPLFLGVLFLVHPWLGWLTLAGAGVVALLAWVNRAVTRTAIRHAAAFDSTERTFADKGRGSAEAIIAMGMEGSIARRWRQLHEGTLASGQRGSDPSEMLVAASRAFRMLLQSAILTMGAYLVLQGHISGGMIIAASILSGRALAPVDQVIGQWRTIGRALEAHRRLGAFFAAQTRQATARIDLPAPSGQLSVSRLTKLAPGADGADRARILNQVSFTLEPGDGLGVIGNSASGKSSLARLIVGAWTADGGEIRMDGATPDQWDPAVLGRHVGYLPQTFELLPGTIRDNIARFDPDATDAAVIEAARLAGVHEMILGLPRGYATQLSGPGEALPLSGGQIQRLGLARALYGTPRLVVLDEPNSNLDVAGDDALAAAIAALRAKGTTVIVMAHRPSAIAAVNKVLILHGGMVARFGDKDTVLTALTQGGPALAPVPNVAVARTATPAAPAKAAAKAAADRAGYGPKPHRLSAQPATDQAATDQATARNAANAPDDEDADLGTETPYVTIPSLIARRVADKIAAKTTAVRPLPTETGTEMGTEMGTKTALPDSGLLAPGSVLPASASVGASARGPADTASERPSALLFRRTAVHQRTS